MAAATAPVAPPSLLSRRGHLAADLVDAIRDLGETRAALVTVSASAWQGNPHLGVTERREQVKVDTADLASEVERQAAEVEALRVQLGHLDAEITWLFHIAGEQSHAT